MEYIATCKLGLESTVVFELKKLNMKEIKAEDAAVSFSGDFSDMARALIYLRTAERLLLKITEFKAVSFEELFDGIFTTDFKPYLTPHSRIHVKGKSAKSTLFSVSDCQSIAKKAIVENLKAAYGVSVIPEDGPEIIVDIGLLRDTVTVALDCCGAGLSRRGYRTYNVAAPISETLGAGLVELSRYWPDTPLIDPMCGSGTIAIEAAMIGNHVPPSLNRRFSAEDWPFLDGGVFLLARQEGQDKITHNPLPVYGYDIDERSVAISRIHAKKAGVNIRFEVRDVRDFKTEFTGGTLLCNPPYGERMMSSSEVSALYKAMYSVFSALPGFKIGIVSAVRDFEKLYGRKADTRRKLSNGGMSCTFYQYYPLTKSGARYKKEEKE